MSKSSKTSKNFIGIITARLCPEGNRTVKNLIFTLISIALAIASLGAVIYYICGPMEGYLHADYTDTIYWANASYESGKILDPDFKYAGILPFSANLWFIPYIAIFGVSMTAHKLGMITFLILLSAAVWFMLRSFKWSVASVSLTLSALLMLLSGSDKLREIMWGHVIYYSLALLLLCVGLGLIARLTEPQSDSQTNKKKRNAKMAIFLALTALFFAGNATNGLQLIVLVTLPCLAALLADVILSPDKKLLHRDNTRPYITAAVIAVATVIGYLLLFHISKWIHANYTDYYNTLMPLSSWLDNLLKLPEYWFSLFGNSLDKTTMILEKEGIYAVIFTLVGILLAVLPIAALCSYRKIRDRGTRMILIAHLAVSVVILFGYVCGALGDRNWRMVPMLATSILASAAAIRHFATLPTERSFVPRRIACILAALMMMASLVNFNTLAKMDKNYGRDGYLHKLTQELEARELEYGYATFWQSQSITLLSDSKVKTRMVLADEEDGVTTDYYQNSFRWYEDQEGVDKYFVLLSLSENRAVEKSDKWRSFVESTKHEKEYLLNSYVLYIFEENLDFPDPSEFK